MKNTSRARNLSLTIAAGLAVVTLASCGQQGQSDNSDDGQDDQPETVIVYRDSTEQDTASSSGTASTTTQTTDDDADDNMQSASELPSGFPVPIADDHEVVRVGESGRELAADLRVPDGREAYDYYTRTLESEGFTIEETDVDGGSSRFDADIDFRNAGFEGSIDFSGTDVEMDLERQEQASSAGGSGSESGGSASSVDEDIPGDLPLPGDYEIRSVRVGGDDAGDSRDVNIVLDVADGRAAYDYYVQNLEGEGFRVEDTEIENDSQQFEGDIDFDGDNYDGNIDVTGNTVEIDIDRMDN